MNELRIDLSLRNTNNPNNPNDVFNRFFRFSDGRGINNTSGFRAKSKADQTTDIENCAFCLLVTTFGEAEWPDSLDYESGVFTYFGDKRTEGDLHKTTVGGNRLLRNIFNKLHVGQRELIPPILVFENYKGVDGSYMRFLGLVAPGAQGVSSFDDLVAVWRIKDRNRFQNYRSLFTVLKENLVSKVWLEDLVNGINPSDSIYCPLSWKRWVETGIYDPLTCERKREPRSKENQAPQNNNESNVLKNVMEGFSDREFEFAAVSIVELMDPRFKDFIVTQRSRDGGRDAIGTYQVGHADHQIQLTAIVEAKLWKENSDIGVKPMSRLISRIKHRDIGVFITTSCFNKQVQKELIDDNHPVILISGGDIARVLIANELDLPEKFFAWSENIKKHAS
jgi:hypothetical protein